MLVALLRQLDAFAKAADDAPDPHAGLRVSHCRRLGDAYEERRDRHRHAVEAAVQCTTFLSDLAEGLAGVNMHVPTPGMPKKLVAAALKLDAVSEEGAEPQGASKRRRRGAA